MPRPHVVIIGGGFAGLYAARALAGAPARVTVVDRRNHHLFQPLLYQVATAVLSPADIAQPIRSLLRGQPNLEVELADVTAIDLANRRVVLADGQIAYDYLILAAGVSHAYFGHDEWRELAPGLKSLEDALDIRRRILLAFERAEREADPARRQALMTFVVVGGGPTGVELAGAIAEIAHHSLAKDFDRIDPTTARVILVEAGPRLLVTFPEKLSQAALDDLRRLSVETRLSAPVTGIEPGIVHIGTDAIAAETVLWAAGVAASPLSTTMGVELDRAGRVVVERTLSVPGQPEVYVAGDLASLPTRRGQPLPGTAPVAIQEGRWAARNVIRAIAGLPPLPFVYRDRGNMATIGRNSAVADIRGIKLTGFVAWLAWAVVHIFNLIGFHNRVLVAFQWVWGYLTFQRGARLITNEVDATTKLIE
ncbi:MAG: NAD(P)/FAD-dependent oxidoreductase [Chloroflexota bacterium]|nr:NAD(P)/FAD-dependent oxidoreductase [Chloroflexota bacterium]